MDRSPQPGIDIEPEHCPEAVIEWFHLTELKDRKASAGRRDLALKAKQHLLFLGWKFWYVDKKCRWELRYTSTNGKTFPTLKLACQNCIESGGCSLKQPSTAAKTTSISSSQLQSKKRPRDSEVTREEDGVFRRKHPSFAAAAPPPATSIFSIPLQSMNQPRECKVNEVDGSFFFKHPSFAASPAAAETSIFLSPLQSMNQPREYQETNQEDGVSFLQHPSFAAPPAEEAPVFSFPFQSIMQPSGYEETNEENGDFFLKHPSTAAPPAAPTSIPLSPLQLKEQPRESEETDENGGCSLNQPSTATPAAALTATLISSPPLQSKEKPRESKETDDSTSSSDSDDDSTSSSDSDDDSTSSSDSHDDSTSSSDSELSNSSFGKKAPVTMVSTSKENEKQESQSESEVTNSVGSGERGMVLKMSAMEKNSESCGNRGKVLKTSIMEKNSEGRGKRGMVLKREGVRERYSLISWLIKNQVLVPGTDVFCRGSNSVVKRGSLFSDGIVCDCCQVNFTVTGFEAHAGCTRHRPSTSILLQDGRSLLQCQREAQSSHEQTGSHCVAEANSEANNDNVCLICGFGGDIVLCDRCPSSFHLSCLGLDRVPDGDWFCPTCCCKICYGPKCKQECADQNNNSILACAQCEQKYHFGCVKASGFGSSETESNAKKKNWFCSVVCGNMFLCLKKLLGKPITIADNITWTLLKNNASSDYDYDGGNFTSYDFSLNKRKLNAALGVLYESFNPTIDAFTGRELIKDVVFSRDSKHNRLNFRGFYNVILEKMGVVVSVATIRIYGPKVAEIVFVATKEQYRRQGLCRLLMDELEKQLIRLGVGSFVLHSSEHAINTWTKSFGFNRMTGKDKCRFIDNTFLEFQNSIMCLKQLNRPTWPYIAR